MNEGGVRLRHRGATARGVAIVLVVGLSTAALSGSLQAQFADQHELLAEPFLLLRVTASPETVRTADQIITFRVEYHNAGTSTADSVILHFFGPNEAAGQYFTELVSLSRAAADTEFVTGSKFRWAIFPIGTLRPGERGEVEVRLRLAPDALETRTLTGVATIRSPGYRASSSAADVIAVFQARTQTDKRLVTGAYFGSDSILFIITVRNTGNWAADSVVVWDFLPPGMRFVSSKPDTFETREDTLIWVIPRIEAQTSFAILVRTYLPWPAEPRPGELHNTCGSRLKEVRSAPYVLHFPVEIPPLPDLVPEWIPPANVLSPGYPASLSLRVHNRGGAPARSFWLTLYVDAVPTDSIHIDGLPARSLSDLPWVKWTPSDTGRYQLVVIADRGEQIREMNEANNADTLWVRVGITSLNVVIRSVTLSDTLPNRLPDGAESAGFPCPILSYVSITDQNGLPVLGLADTGRWLGAGDTTLLGLPIPEIWRTLLEYHLADPTYPPYSDVYRAGPVWIREVRTVRPPVSVVLVMDYSGSMGGYESTVEAASLAFLSNLQAGDRVGIVHFRGGVTIVSSLTSDLARVAASIPGHAATGFTAMYDGLYTAIGMLAGIDGPKIIVLYTDGWDNASHWTPSDVVTLAREAGVSIYCLGIGSDVDQRSLTSIASSTGGMAEFGLDVQSLYQFYDKILSLISSYYWLAYCSPDPEFNCSWRVLDVSVQLYAAAGRDTAHYLAPCGGPDASIWKHAVVDSYYVSPSVGDTIGFVASGETFTYIIRVRNAGGDFHMGSEVFDVLPPGYVLMEASPPPTEARGDTLMWRVPALRAADTWAATLRLKAEYDPYRTSTRFVNVAWITNDEDTVLVNNRAADTLYALPPEPIPPEIMVAPPVIEPRDSVTVTILTHIPAVRWWVEVELGDGSKIFDYPRRPLRDSTELVAGTPFTLPEKFVRTQLVTRGERERLRFWVVIEDPLGRTLRSRPADVIIRGANNVLLSRNVFRPGRDPNLIVRLKLSSNRTATVKILDISGRVVVVLAQDQFFLAGWNEIAWDGRDSHGNLVGPGIYVLTVESDPIREWLKFVIIR